MLQNPALRLCNKRSLAKHVSMPKPSQKSHGYSQPAGAEWTPLASGPANRAMCGEKADTRTTTCGSQAAPRWRSLRWYLFSLQLTQVLPHAGQTPPSPILQSCELLPGEASRIPGRIKPYITMLSFKTVVWWRACSILDDWGWASWGLHRPRPSAEVQTPNLDHLGESGVVLDRMISYKFCGPSRSALLSGR